MYILDNVSGLEHSINDIDNPLVTDSVGILDLI